MGPLAKKLRTRGMRAINTDVGIVYKTNSCSLTYTFHIYFILPDVRVGWLHRGVGHILTRLADATKVLEQLSSVCAVPEQCEHVACATRAEHLHDPCDVVARTIE